MLKKSWNLFLFLSFEWEPWQIFIVRVVIAEKVFKVRDQWVITLTLSWWHMTYKPNKLGQIDLVFVCDQSSSGDVVTDPSLRLSGFDVTRQTWSLLTIFVQVGALVMQTCTNEVLPNHRYATVVSSRPWTILLTHVHERNLKADCNYFAKLKKMQSSCRNL